MALAGRSSPAGPRCGGLVERAGPVAAAAALRSVGRRPRGVGAHGRGRGGEDAARRTCRGPSRCGAAAGRPEDHEWPDVGFSLEQGFITQQMANWLNLVGAVALMFIIWELAASPDSMRVRRRLRWSAALTMFATLVALTWLHQELDSLLSIDRLVVRDRSLFYEKHQWYLIISAAQWTAALIWLFLTMWVWQAEDRGASGG